MMKDHQQASGRSPEAFMAIFYVICFWGRPAGKRRKPSRLTRVPESTYRRQIACEVKLAMRAGPSGREAREARAVTGHLRFYTNFTYLHILHAIFRCFTCQFGM